MAVNHSVDHVNKKRIKTYIKKRGNAGSCAQVLWLLMHL